MALIAPNGWKLGRLVVYRDVEAAKRAMAALRADLVRCARHDEGGGFTTAWQVEALDIGDEAFFIGGQGYAGATAVNVHFRGVAVRQGRAVFSQLDHGRLTTPPTLEEVAGHRENAAAMAARLAVEPWAQ